MKPVFSIDRCEYREDVLLLQGWILPPDDGQNVLLTLLGHNDYGEEWRVNVPVDLDRPDVCAHYPHLANRPCGFFFYGRLPRGRLSALVVASDAADIPLLEFCETEGSRLAGHTQAWINLARQAWQLFRSGKWRLLHEKSLRRLKTAMAPTIRLDRTLQARLNELDIDLLIIDHDLGGGANHYRQTLIKNTAGSGRRVALIIYSLLRFGYVLSVHDNYGSHNIGVISPKEIRKVIELLSPASIFYNNAVSDPDALNLVTHLVGHKLRTGCRLVLAIHDYFVVCPSPHLLNADTLFCEIPSAIDLCRQCLHRSRQPFVDLYRNHDIALWRARWRRLLACADEIILFSPSSVGILKQVYPALEDKRLVLHPHHVEPLSSKEKRLIERWHANRSPSGVIAAVGAITSPAKGSHILQQLAQWLHDHAAAWRLHVIGTCAPKICVEPPYYQETGPYHRDALTELVTTVNPDVFIFPSVAPETFSFVLHEVARYERPIAAFPIGAQRDFLAHYPLAIVLPLSAQSNPADLVTALSPHLH